MLFEFAKSLKGHLKQYLLPSLRVILTMITEKHSHDVRSSASLALSKTFEAYIDAVQKGFISKDSTTTNTTYNTATNTTPNYASNTNNNNNNNNNDSCDRSSNISEVLSACLGKLLECLKGEINCTSRACAAESLKDILLACYTSGTQQVDGSRNTSFLCTPDLQISTAIAQELLRLCQEAIGRKQQREVEFQSNEGVEEEDREAYGMCICV